MPSLRTLPRPADVLAAAADLVRVARHRDEIRARVRMLAGKAPAVVRGVRLVLKKDRNEALSIGTFLAANAARDPDGPAILYEDRRYSHRELHELSNRWAHLLRARGVRKGDAVAVLMEGRPELLFCVAGIVKLGAVAAVINTKQRGPVLEHSLRISQARVFVVGEELWEAFSAVRGALGTPPPEQVLWVRDGGEGAAPQEARDAGPELATAPSHTPAELASVRLGDPCFYISTSGTTGLPKAAIMSHFRWVKAAGGFGQTALAMGPGDVLYVPLPFYHNNALTVAWSSAASGGAALAMRRRFSVTHFWEDVRRFRATAFVYIGELCRYLLNAPPRPDDRDHGVRRMIGNGLRPDIWTAFKERFGIEEVYEFYAASECNVVFMNLLNLDRTVGICPARYALVRYDVDRDEPVRDAEGRLVLTRRGEVGLLLAEVSERYAFDGYTDKRASERKLLRDVFEPGDVWYDSGDLMRDQGFRHAQFVDRVGDTFRWKGENVSTTEVAEILNGWPQIEESTVYGVAIPGAEGRCGMAAIVARVPPESFDLAGLAGMLKDQLPRYAWPVFLRFQPKLEVTGTFKQVKGALRADGFDLGKTRDPIYFLPPRSDGYVPLTPELQRQIERGEVSP